MSITINRSEVGLSDVRPWGSWEVLDEGLHHKVKRITVRLATRGSRCRRHAHRSEHWVVVSGVATCTIGDREVVLHPGERVHVPMGERAPNRQRSGPTC